MKKHISLFLIVLSMLGISLFLTGCKNNSAPDTKTDLSVSTDESSVETNSSKDSAFTDLSSFSCKTLDGESLTEKILSEKDLTIMNFWSTTCNPCIQEIPELEELRKTLPDNTRLILVCLDDSSKNDIAKEILSQSGYTGTAVMCGEGDMEKINRQILYVPTTLFFDSAGKQIGTALLGSPTDLFETYTQNINGLLEDMGKDAIWKN